MDIKLITPDALSAAEVTAWKALRASNPKLYSPYFHPAYSQAVGKLRRDAFVAIAYSGNDPVSFFPFQGPRGGRSGFARPIGAPMTDYQGFIEAPNTKIDHFDMLRKAGIGALHYSAFVDSAPDIAAYHQAVYPACVLDFTQGVKAWRGSRDSSYTRSLKKNRRRIRKAEAEIGARRLEWKSTDKALFEQLVHWKKEKFAETYKFDVLSSWTLQLLENLWASNDELTCDLHALYFGDHLAAIDLGLTDGVTYHSWMVGYNSDFHVYSPGTQLLEALIEQSEDLGYQRIDLGLGQAGYKKAYMSDQITASSGFIPVRGSAAALGKVYAAAEKFGERNLGDIPGKMRRRYSQIAACDDTFSGRAKAMLAAIKSGGGRS